MSELKFLGYNNQGGFVEVFGGWNSSLEQFFLRLVDLKRGVLFDSVAPAGGRCTPKQQLEVFYQHDLLVPNGWFSDLEAKSALVQHYGTTGWLVRDAITYTHGEENYSSARANVYNHVQPVLLIVDTGENSGMSAVNCIERLREAVFLQRPAHPWLSSSIQSIVCSASAYSKPDQAEYAVWDGTWRFIARDKVVELTGDRSLPLWRS